MLIGRRYDATTRSAVIGILITVFALAIPASPHPLAIWIDSKGALRRTSDSGAVGPNSPVVASGVTEAAYDRKLNAVAYVSGGTLTIRLFGHARSSVPANARRVDDGFEIRTAFRPTRGRLTWWTEHRAITFTSGSPHLEVRGIDILKGRPDAAELLISGDHLKRALTSAKESVWGASYRPNSLQFAFICGGDLWFGYFEPPLTRMEENSWSGARALPLAVTDAGTKAVNEAAEALDTVWSEDGKWLAVSINCRKVFDRFVIVVDGKGKELNRVRGEFPVPWGNQLVLLRDGMLIAFSPATGKSRDVKAVGWAKPVYVSSGFRL